MSSIATKEKEKPKKVGKRTKCQDCGVWYNTADGHQCAGHDPGEPDYYTPIYDGRDD